MFGANNISYLHKDVSIDSINNTNIVWEQLKEPIYKGFDNGVYWFKIELEASNKGRIISIPEAHISRANLFIEGKEINKLAPKRYVTFKIPNSRVSQTYYLRVNCLLDATIPIEIKSVEKFYETELKEYIVIGLYIGIVLAIMLFNLFSYYSFGNRTYLFYIFMVLGLASNAFYKDGLTAYFFGLNSFNEKLEPFINTIVPITAIYFTRSYLMIEHQLKRLRFFGISIVVITIVLEVIYLIYGSFSLFTSIALLNLISITVFYMQGPILWKKSSYAKFFTIAYGILLFFAYDFYISPHFGIKFLDLPLSFYKVGSILEMIIFSYAIMYQAKQMNKKNNIMREKLVDYTQKLKNLNQGLNERPDTTTELIEKYSLTLKEIEILKVLSLKKTNKEIADSQFISENTVKFHIRNICKKLGVNSKREAQNQYLNVKKEELGR